jgi:hypothetical protein
MECFERERAGAFKLIVDIKWGSYFTRCDVLFAIKYHTAAELFLDVPLWAIIEYIVQ